LAALLNDPRDLEPEALRTNWW